MINLSLLITKGITNLFSYKPLFHPKTIQALFHSKIDELSQTQKAEHLIQFLQSHQFDLVLPFVCEKFNETSFDAIAAEALNLIFKKPYDNPHRLVKNLEKVFLKIFALDSTTQKKTIQQIDFYITHNRLIHPTEQKQLSMMDRFFYTFLFSLLQKAKGYININLFDLKKSPATLLMALYQFYPLLSAYINKFWEKPKIKSAIPLLCILFAALAYYCLPSKYRLPSAPTGCKAISSMEALSEKNPPQDLYPTELSQIISILAGNNGNSSSRQHVVVTGKAGSGKSSVIELLGSKLSKGEIRELEGCILYTFGGSSLRSLVYNYNGYDSDDEEPGYTTSSSGLSTVASQLKQDGTLDKAIIFVDEIQGLFPPNWQNKEEHALSPLLEELKLLLTNNDSSSFRYFICATTTEFYPYLADDPALGRRLRKVKIKPDSSKTMQVLQRLAQTDAPEFEIPQEYLDAIYAESEQLNCSYAQPSKAINLFREKVATARQKFVSLEMNSQWTSLSKKLEEKGSKLSKLDPFDSNLEGKFLEITREMEEIKKNLEKLTDADQARKNLRDHVFKLREFSKASERRLQTLLSTDVSPSSLKQNTLKKVIWLRKILHPTLKTIKMDLASKVGLTLEKETDFS